MPSEFHNREPPLPFGNPKSRPWYSMDIFWNRPFRYNNYNPKLNCMVMVSLENTHHYLRLTPVKTLSQLHVKIVTRFSPS